MKFVMIDGKFINLDNVSYIKKGFYEDGGSIIIFNDEKMSLNVSVPFDEVVALIGGEEDSNSVAAAGPVKVSHSESVLREPLDYSEMSVRLANVCGINGLHYAGDLVLKSRRELIKYPNFGNVCFNEMVDYLKWNHGVEYNYNTFLKYDFEAYSEWRRTV